jgi:hypothetical protein
MLANQTLRFSKEAFEKALRRTFCIGIARTVYCFESTPTRGSSRLLSVACLPVRVIVIAENVSHAKRITACFIFQQREAEGKMLW